MGNRICQVRDAEALALLRKCDGAVALTFAELKQLLGSEKSAVRAFKEENEFVTVHPEWQAGPERAIEVRLYLVSNDLPWNQFNLMRAAREVLKEPNGQ